MTAPFQCLGRRTGSTRPARDRDQPGNPTQIFQGSDGGMIRTSGTFSDISSRCNSNERPLLGASSARQLQAAALAGADVDPAHRHELQQHAPVRQRRDQPVEPARSWAGPRTTAPGRTTAAATRNVEPGHLRRRRQRRLRHDDRPGASTSSRAAPATPTSRTAIPRSGSSRRRRSSAAARERRSTGRRSATRTRCPGGRTRCTRGRSTSGGRGRSAPACRATCRRTRRRTSRATRRTARSSPSRRPARRAATTGRSAARTAKAQRRA